MKKRNCFWKKQKDSGIGGIVTVNIDRSTGQLANGGNSREEYFIEGTQPTQQAVHEVGTTIIDNGEAQELF